MNLSKINIMFSHGTGDEICLMMSAQMLLVLQHTGSASKIDGTSVRYCNISQICLSKKLVSLPSDPSSCKICIQKCCHFRKMTNETTGAVHFLAVYETLVLLEAVAMTLVYLYRILHG